MHELSLCRAIADTVAPHTTGHRVEVVRVRIGALRQVVPKTLSSCWAVVREHVDMPGAELELELVPAAVTCGGCGRESVIESRWSVHCPRCDSADVTVVRGEEFLVTSVDVS